MAAVVVCHCVIGNSVWSTSRAHCKARSAVLLKGGRGSCRTPLWDVRSNADLANWVNYPGRVPLPISSSSVPPSLAPAPLLYFAKFAERDADNDGAASGAEGTEMSHSTERLG